ncbi:MAG: nucleotidyl transferase AbiEii/AbiGii toxin family protein [Bacteroidales bacterium]|nr:nucleotidyl transferase AbiEii/AbiGii toxin family protein [Bacteroidales bacterium]
MISEECFTPEWIFQKSKELKYNDKNIIEKVIRAFSLLDMLAESGCKFIFKGGSCLMLLLKNRRHRLSIDIDIICPPGTEIEQYLHDFKRFGFIDYQPVERIQRSVKIPKSHSKFFYQVAFLGENSRQECILLDVLNEESHYDSVLQLPINLPFFEIEGVPNSVNVPSLGDILGDKLTAYAPNTTGIPYIKNGRDCSMEIIKQLYDVGRIFDEITTLEITLRSFPKIAEVEMSYRKLTDNPVVIYDDIIQTSLCIATYGAEGKGNFDMLKNGISRIKNFMYGGNYLINNAIVDASRAAYIAALLSKGISVIEKYNGNPLSIAKLEIKSSLPSRLNRLKRQSPEAYYYFAKVSELLG